MNNTISYYNQNATQYVASTVAVDFSQTQNKFLDSLPHQGKILDFGCGSGRDSKYFLEKGYAVDALDGSRELCLIARQHTGLDVKETMFSEFSEYDMYDGIWACSSILHLPKSELKEVILHLKDALKNNGVLYTSFKYSLFEGERNGRYFTDFTIESFREFIQFVPELIIQEYWISGDVRQGRGNEKWLNLLMKKQSNI